MCSILLCNIWHSSTEDREGLDLAVDHGEETPTVHPERGTSPSNSSLMCSLPPQNWHQC